MSLDTYLGRRGNILAEGEEHAALVHVPSPVLLDDEMAALMRPEFGAMVLPITFDAAGGEAASSAPGGASAGRGAGRRLRRDPAHPERPRGGGGPGGHPRPAGHRGGAPPPDPRRQADAGRPDRADRGGLGHPPPGLPHRLRRRGGAPLPGPGLQPGLRRAARFETTPETELEARYRKAADKGLFRIMSKMGISAVSSYRGAQIFEAVGVSQALIDSCFSGTPSRIGGIGLAEVSQEALRRHDDAYRPAQPWAPACPTWALSATRRTASSTATTAWPWWRCRRRPAAGSTPTTGPTASSSTVAPRGPAGRPRPCAPGPGRRAGRGGAGRGDHASLLNPGHVPGGPSPEAHATLAVGMNRIGARSNTGEGGEDPAWWQPFADGPFAGERANSKIKQVRRAVRGDSGVPPARRGAGDQDRPGGQARRRGQLPAHKVTGLIARLRHAIPGIPHLPARTTTSTPSRTWRS